MRQTLGIVVILLAGSTSPASTQQLTRGQWLVEALSSAGCSADWLWQAMSDNHLTEITLDQVVPLNRLVIPAGCQQPAPAFVAAQSRFLIRRYGSAPQAPVVVPAQPIPPKAAAPARATPPPPASKAAPAAQPPAPPTPSFPVPTPPLNQALQEENEELKEANGRLGASNSKLQVELDAANAEARRLRQQPVQVTEKVIWPGEFKLWLALSALAGALTAALIALLYIRRRTFLDSDAVRRIEGRDYVFAFQSYNKPAKQKLYFCAVRDTEKCSEILSPSDLVAHVRQEHQDILGRHN